jgi:hypothetical protein
MPGIAGILSDVFGDPVVLFHGTPQARDVQGVFRHSPRRVDAGGVDVETVVPILRASRVEMAALREGDLIDPKDGHIYRFLFAEDALSSEPDALVSAQLERIE